MLETLQVNDYSVGTFTELNDSLLYLDYINNTYDFKIIMIDPSVAYRYQGNFIGLMKELGISTSLYLFTMYINGITNPVEYDGVKTTLRLAISPPIPTR